MKQELSTAVSLRGDSCSSILRLLLAVEEAEGSYLVRSESSPVTLLFPLPSSGQILVSTILLVKLLSVV